MTPRRPFPAPPVPALAIHGPDGISQIHLTLGPPECVLSAQPWDGREEMAGRRHLRSTRPGLGQRLGAWVMVRCREGGRSQRQLGVARVNGGLAEIVGPERYGGAIWRPWDLRLQSLVWAFMRWRKAGLWSPLPQTRSAAACEGLAACLPQCWPTCSGGLRNQITPSGLPSAVTVKSGNSKDNFSLWPVPFISETPNSPILGSAENSSFLTAPEVSAVPGIVYPVSVLEPVLRIQYSRCCGHRLRQLLELSGSGEHAPQLG